MHFCPVWNIGLHVAWGTISPFSPPALQDGSGEGDHWVEFAQWACKTMGSTPNTK